MVERATQVEETVTKQKPKLIKMPFRDAEPDCVLASVGIELPYRRLIVRVKETPKRRVECVGMHLRALQFRPGII